MAKVDISLGASRSNLTISKLFSAEVIRKNTATKGFLSFEEDYLKFMGFFNKS